METGRPVVTEQADYSKSPKLIFPGQTGAHMWEPMSYSRESGLVYIPMLEYPMVYSFRPTETYEPGVANVHVDILYDDTPDIAIQRKEFDGAGPNVFLQAWDPRKQKEAWRVQVEHFENSGGILSTAGGLVFQGDAGGYLKIYASKSGELLKEVFVGTGIMAGPVSYMVDGEQYVSVMAGVGGSNYWSYPEKAAARRYGNDGRIVAFRLGGGDVPLPPTKTHVWPKPPEAETSVQMVERGRLLYDQARCSWCHGVEAEPGILPDMLSLTPGTHQIFKEIVLDGLYESKGMAGFSDVLSENDVTAIQAYILDEAHKQKAWLRGVGEGT
jgi:quinohemoprotein ethanol dehydrogenase